MARLSTMWPWTILIAGCLAATAPAEDWPTYRHDNQRSAVSTESIAPPLSEDWTFTPLYGPSHAWGDPQPKPVGKLLERSRLRFDDAFHVTAAGGLVFFGSSSEGKVCALDAATGEIRWEFFTEGPVRMAPTVAGGKVYVGSDDGKVYCLSAADGRAVWTLSAAPSPERVLGNGRMISLWPVRTGVVVDGGVAYFGAGVFPAEGLYLYAVSAGDGRLLWKNDTYGLGGSGTVSPQGYLVASREKLFIPSGRAMPAAFSRSDGKFLFHRNFSWRAIGLSGGTDNLLAGNLLVTATEQVVGTNEADGQLALTEGIAADTPSAGVHRLAIDGNALYLVTGSEAVCADAAKWIAYRKSVTVLKVRIAVLTTKRNNLNIESKTNPAVKPQLEDVGKELNATALDLKALESARDDGVRWRAACRYSEALSITRGMVLVGGDGVVVGLDPASGKEVWATKLQGKARGIAIAGGRVFVSTDNGAIHCFVSGSGGKGRKVAPKKAVDVLPDDARASFFARTADGIVKESGMRRGYALVLGGTGRLALELARQTELIIYVIEPDAAKAAAMRKMLSAAGVYGARVTVTQAALDAVPFADYFANLIVCEDGFTSEKIAAPPPEVLRMLKPCGGVAYAGRPPSAGDPPPPVRQAVDAWAAGMKNVLRDLGEKDTKVDAVGPWVKVVRGPLPGAGSWTHEYANAGNTACSDDTRVRGPIGILWFGEPGPGRMPSRHSSAAAPLAIGGRMFVQGENVVMAYDAYNGLLLWERDIQGALRLGLKTGSSNLAANENSVFVAAGDTCYRLDAATGDTVRKYKAPPAINAAPRNWAWLACVGGTVFGSTGTDTVFACDMETGRLRWLYDGKNIMQPTITVGGGKVFFVDRAATPEEVQEALKAVPAEARVDRSGKPIKPDVRLVVALDGETGKVLWSKPQYVADTVKVGSSGGDLAAMYADGLLVISAQPWNGHFWKEFLAGEFSRRGIITLSADDGRTVWSGRKGYRSRPLIVGDQIIAEPWAYDLRTGEQRQRHNPITGETDAWQMARPGHHCGNIAASPAALFFRSGSTAYYDLTGDYGTAHFGAQRPGCWINCIPANGLVMMPEAASGCMCPFAIHTTIVFEPRKASRVWGMFSTPGPAMPVRRLAINFGAPGDRRAADGTLWLSYPRPMVTERLVLDLKVQTQALTGGGFFAANTDFARFEGTADNWIYSSGARGVTQFIIPLDAPGAAPAKYTVRLLFAESENTKAGARVFDVKLQGKTVLAGFDIFKAAGGAGRAIVKELKDIEAGENLTLDLVPQGNPGTPAAMPLVSGIEIIRQ
jgi:outer membrane protein assembly factor BamB